MKRINLMILAAGILLFAFASDNFAGRGGGGLENATAAH